MWGGYWQEQILREVIPDSGKGRKDVVSNSQGDGGLFYRPRKGSVVGLEIKTPMEGWCPR